MLPSFYNFFFFFPCLLNVFIFFVFFIFQADNLSVEDLRLLSIILASLTSTVSDSILEQFSGRVLSMLEQDLFASSTADGGLKSICKLISLVFPLRAWHMSNPEYLLKLLLALDGKVAHLNALQIRVVSKAIRMMHWTPASVFNAVTAYYQEIISDEKRTYNVPKLTALRLIGQSLVFHFGIISKIHLKFNICLACFHCYFKCYSTQ